MHQNHTEGSMKLTTETVMEDTDFELEVDEKYRQSLQGNL